MAPREVRTVMKQITAVGRTLGNHQNCLNCRSKVIHVFSERELFIGVAPLPLGSDGLKVLFVDFNLHLMEVEGIGLPVAFSELVSNATVHVLDTKHQPDEIIDLTKGNDLGMVEGLQKYDLIVTRGAGVKRLVANNIHNIELDGSHVVNVKSMSVAGNAEFCDEVWTEESFCPVAHPIFAKLANQAKREFGKQEIVLVPGRIGNIKNQLALVRRLDRRSLGKKTLVFLGPSDFSLYGLRLFSALFWRQLNFLFTFKVSKEQSAQIQGIAKLSVIPMDMRINSQPKGYPRSLGELIAAGVPTVVNKPITVPDYFEKSVFRHDFKNKSAKFVLPLDFSKLAFHEAPSYPEFLVRVTSRLLESYECA